MDVFPSHYSAESESFHQIQIKICVNFLHDIASSIQVWMATLQYAVLIGLPCSKYTESYMQQGGEFECELLVQQGGGLLIKHLTIRSAEQSYAVAVRVLSLKD